MTQKSDSFSKTQKDFSWIDEISKETIIKVLIHKNITNPKELVDLEQQARRKSHAIHHTNHHSSSPLKRLASKKRWARKLTHILLGWEWKKVKTTTNEQVDSY